MGNEHDSLPWEETRMPTSDFGGNATVTMVALPDWAIVGGRSPCGPFRFDKGRTCAPVGSQPLGMQRDMGEMQRMSLSQRTWKIPLSSRLALSGSSLLEYS